MQNRNLPLTIAGAVLVGLPVTLSTLAPLAVAQVAFVAGLVSVGIVYQLHLAFYATPPAGAQPDAGSPNPGMPAPTRARGGGPSRLLVSLFLTWLALTGFIAVSALAG